MDRDVEGAIGALLRGQADTIVEEYADQKLVVAYGETEYDAPEALADDLQGDAPDVATPVTYDDLAAVLDGDAVYHELLHGHAFTSDRPAREAVDRMRMEQDDRTSTGRGLDEAGSGLRFHVEADPFLALWEEDGGTRYAAVQVIPEARSASCRRTRITYPGKVFATTGVLAETAPDDILPAVDGPTEEAAEGDDRGEDSEPATDGPSCALEREEPDVLTTPAGERREELPDEDTDRMAKMERIYHSFTKDGAWTEDAYQGMMRETADNLDRLGSLANLLHDYVAATVAAGDGNSDDRPLLRDRVEDELNALLDADTVGFEDGTSDLAANFGGATRFTRDTTVYGVSPPGDAPEDRLTPWEERLKETDAKAYTMVRRENRRAAILVNFLGDGDGSLPLPGIMINHLFDGDSVDWDALDAFLTEDHEQDDGFDGNETTWGMYQ